MIACGTLFGQVRQAASAEIAKKIAPTHLLEEELTARIEADTMGTQGVLNLLGLLDDKAHSLIPARAFQFSVLADHGVGQTVRVVVGFPTEHALWTQAALVHSVRRQTTHTDDLAVLDADVPAGETGRVSLCLRRYLVAQPRTRYRRRSTHIPQPLLQSTHALLIHFSGSSTIRSSTRWGHSPL